MSAPARPATAGTAAADRLVSDLRRAVGTHGPGDRVSTGPAAAWPETTGRWQTRCLAAASVAAATSAAADLLARRVGDGSTSAHADPEHAWASFRSEALLRVGGTVLPAADPVTGDYVAADRRWVRVHGNFLAHRRAIWQALDLPAGATKGDVERRIAQIPAGTVEEAVVRHGGSAAALRDPEEWAEHPQGRNYPLLPVMAISRLGPGRPAWTVPPDGTPAGGVRVLDLSRVIAGPVAARVLASHGATVIRVGARTLEQVPHLWVDTGFGKLSADADLTTAAGARALHALVRGADVVLHAFRPGSLARAGFSAQRRAEDRAGVVWVDLSAWGPAGPWRDRRGFDSIVQMATGLAASGRADGRPEPLPVQALDHATGWLAAFGALTALARQADEGGSWRVVTSLAQTAALLASLGPAPHAPQPLPPKLPAQPDAQWLTETPSPYGRLVYVRPPGTVAGAHSAYSGPPTRPGSHPPAWPPRRNP